MDFSIIYFLGRRWYNIRESNEQCAYKKTANGLLADRCAVFLVRIGRMPVNEENEVFRVGTADMA